MLKTKPEMVLIATPHTMHCCQTVKSLKAGIDVLCEKPMSHSVSSAVEMAAAAEESGKVLDIGFTMPFHPIILRLKEIISDGSLGTVLYANAKVGTYETLVNSKSHYQANQAGALVLDYAHQPDLFYWLLGKKPAFVYASALQGGDLELSSNPNVAVINCEYDCPLVTSVHLNYVQMPARQEYEIVGDKGWVIADIGKNCLTIGSRKNASTATETFTIERDDMYRAEHQAFLDAVERKRKPETSATDGLVSMAVCEAAVNSWKTHQRIEVKV